MVPTCDNCFSVVLDELPFVDDSNAIMFTMDVALSSANRMNHIVTQPTKKLITGLVNLQPSLTYQPVTTPSPS